MLTSILRLQLHLIFNRLPLFLKSMNYFENSSYLCDAYYNELHLLVCASDLTDNGTCDFTNMLKQDNSSSFTDSTMVEIKDHTQREHWEVTHRHQIPARVKTMYSVWSFKRKRFPSGVVNKHKERLCVDGSRQTWGVNYWEKHYPVVNLFSVRLLLDLSRTHNV